MSSLVENYLITQRIDDTKKDVRSISVQVAPYLVQSDATEMYNIVSQSSQDLGGRMLVLNDSGIVQTDSFSAMNGMHRTENEVYDILYGKNSTSYGFHKIPDNSGDGYFWAIYCTASVINNGKTIGVVLYSSSIQNVVQETENLRLQMLWIYLIACVIIFLCSMFMTNIVTKPVQQLTNAAIKISNGDLGSRTHIKGRNELAELGRTFNMMSDRLQNMDKQRSEFVSDASHELKTPLASMKILVESLLYQDHVDEGVYKEFLADINGEIDRLTGLITDLLLLSKMDEESMGLNVERIDLVSLVKKSVNALLPIASMRKITVDLETPDDLVMECDALKVRQALNNLIENAIKYSYDNGYVDVRVKRIGQEAQVTIADKGVGMDTEHLVHIFERFYRVDKARARDTGGTGLGLYIVRRIALLHGGRVEVSSKDGIGSTFTLVLPVNQPKPMLPDRKMGDKQ